MAMTGVLRPGHISLRVLDLEEGVNFYKNALGLVETGRDSQGRVYFKAWDEREHNVNDWASDSPDLFDDPAHCDPWPDIGQWIEPVKTERHSAQYLADRFRNLVPASLEQLSETAVDYLLYPPDPDNSTAEALGVTFRPISETFEAVFASRNDRNTQEA